MPLHLNGRPILVNSCSHHPFWSEPPRHTINPNDMHLPPEEAAVEETLKQIDQTLDAILKLCQTPLREPAPE